eukprot:gnl/TRDRNA2_/TRDRNA2_165405_c0_seq1.p1 gnl/TRDRNA2_/TRDRNA2_165405_c0~~gnl/TRDRNA2_/TRDRNA2_165405_c0_seq1.p1  ORF type:complete len:342 (-),score=34.89 gnl/TRDRNA2_/TRDRNA2_165405_c0_seq1:334-1293(-)
MWAPAGTGQLQRPTFSHMSPPAAVRTKSPSMTCMMSPPHPYPSISAIGAVLPAHHATLPSQQQYASSPPTPTHTTLGSFPTTTDWPLHEASTTFDGEMMDQPPSPRNEWWGGSGSDGGSSWESSPCRSVGPCRGKRFHICRERNHRERDRSPRCDRSWAELSRGTHALSPAGMRAELRRTKKEVQGRASALDTQGQCRTANYARHGLSKYHTSSRSAPEVLSPRRAPHLQLSARSARAADEAAALRNTRRQVRSLRHENIRLQEELGEAQSLMFLLQMEADHARAECDRELRRSEGLQLSARQLQQQLQFGMSSAVQML